MINDNLLIKQVLFHEKYKPKLFKDFYFDDNDKNIIELLEILIENNEINLILFGPPFSGKTAITNAVINEYYGETFKTFKYDENILRINSLKEQGISYFRNEIKTFCQSSSSVKNKKKFIILDDIDNINESYQQIIRTYIDIYHKNVNFIGCCCNSQKIIESLYSRMVTININLLNEQQLSLIVDNIIKCENINISNDAKQFILSVSTNINNIINYLEKFKLLEEYITLEIAMDNCTNINFNYFKDFTLYVKNAEQHNAIMVLYSIYNKGYSVIDILDNYSLFINTTDIIDENDKYIILPFICKYITIFYNINEDEIELALFTNDIICKFIEEDNLKKLSSNKI